MTEDKDLGSSRAKPALTIVIATWKMRDMLKRCISSITEGGSGPYEYELIVIDNNSSDGTVDMLQSLFPKVKLVSNTHNLGVAAGRNVGIRMALGEFIMLLDADTVVPRGSIMAMVEYLLHNPHIGLIGPRLVSPEGAVQVSSRTFPTLWSKIARRLPNVLGTVPAQRSPMQSCPVDYVIGACQLIRREVVDAIGLLDDSIFYGPEDVDYCVRVWRAGWAVHYFADADVVHWEQRITRNVFSLLFLRHVQGLLYFFWKHRYLFSPPVVDGSVASSLGHMNSSSDR